MPPLSVLVGEGVFCSAYCDQAGCRCPFLGRTICTVAEGNHQGVLLQQGLDVGVVAVAAGRRVGDVCFLDARGKRPEDPVPGVSRDHGSASPPPCGKCSGEGDDG